MKNSKIDGYHPDVPDGATVTPVNNVQTWLKCAGVADKTYRTINEVLADSTTLSILIFSNNASDYLVRSTSWVSSVTNNQNAMVWIGADDYCATILLADSTWRTAICDSTYFESVLNVKVPTMTSNTAPSGTAFANFTTSGNYAPYYVFDGVDSTTWYAAGIANNSIGYMFTKNINVGKCKTDFRGMSETAHSWKIKVQGSADGVTYTDISDSITTESITQNMTLSKTLNCTNTNKYKYFQLYFGRGSGPYNASPVVMNVQFYGH